MLSLSLFTAVSTARADEIDDFVRGTMKELHIPGISLAVIKDGKPVKVQAYGFANVDYDAPANPDTPFLLASMTKTFTATSIMMLAEEGKIDLGAKISTYLDDAPASWMEITVRQLLSHTAGLKDRFEEDSTSATNWTLFYTEDQMYESAKKHPLDSKPGEHWQYSDQGFFLLGRIIEKASGMKYEDFLKKRIFEPLGMGHSSTVNLSRIVKGMAAGYTQIGGQLFHNTRRTDYGLVSHFGIISTVNDLAKWDAALDGEKLLKRASFAAMWKPATIADGSEPFSQYGTYGLGWFLSAFNGHRSVGHGGSTGTAFLKFPEDRLTVIVLTNLEQIAGGDATGIAKAISEMELPALRWSALKPRKDDQPEFAAKVKSVLDLLAQGKLDASLLTPMFYSQLLPVVEKQRAGLGPMGGLKKVELLESENWGTARLNRYKVTFEKFTGYSAVYFDPQGRIGNLTVEGG